MTTVYVKPRPGGRVRMPDRRFRVMPEEGIDALVCASYIVIALQTIVSRRVSPKEASVVSVTQIHGGEAWNVLPDRAVICASSCTSTRTSSRT